MNMNENMNMDANRITVSNIDETDDEYHFQLNQINVSFANAIRRTLLSDIPLCVIKTETEEINQCKIEINTSRFHNEILKQRISCIPIHTRDMDFPKKYTLELNVENKTDNIRFVTTEDFSIRSKERPNNLITDDERKLIFPPNPQTNYYIDIMRLRPKMCDVIPSEQIKLTAEFSIGTAKENGMFNATAKCVYTNTIDVGARTKRWMEIEGGLKKDGLLKEDEILFEKKNFMLLDGNRYFIPDTFSFIVKSVFDSSSTENGYSSKELVSIACEILYGKMNDLKASVESDIVPIIPSETSMEFCYDVVLIDEDYTLGKVIECILYYTHYEGDHILSFCGFKKLHPHNNEGILRLAFHANSDRNKVKEIVKNAIINAYNIFRKVKSLVG
jgi:DNA-directed RNA polymerase subunit L